MPILYLLDNILYIKCEHKIYELNLKECVRLNRIINKKKLIKNINNFFKDNKDIKKIFIKGVIFVSERTLYQIDKDILFDILDSVNINKMKFVNLVDLIKIKKNTLMINITNSYYQIFFKEKENIVDIMFFKKRINDLVKILVSNYSFGNIILLNSNKRVANELERKYKKNTYYIYNKLEYVFNLIEMHK